MNVMMIAGLLGGWEWVVVILAVLMLFGAKRIPELARSLGSSIKEFKKGAREVTDELQDLTNDKPRKAIGNPSKPAQTVSQSPSPKV
jgi:sec-independent protein translocase protein TatA